MKKSNILKIILNILENSNRKFTSKEQLCNYVCNNTNSAHITQIVVAKLLKEEASLQNFLKAKTKKKGTLFAISKRIGAYIEEDTTRRKIKIPYRNCEKYSTGDVVEFVFEYGEVKITKKLNEKSALSSNIKLREKTMVGTVVIQSGNLMLKDINPKNKELFLLKDMPSNTDIGTLILANIADKTASFIEVFETQNKIQSTSKAIAYNAGVIFDSSQKIKEEIQSVDTQVNLEKYTVLSEEEYKNILKRENALVDLREKNFITVDPETCKDMDDAVYTEIDSSGNFVSYVAIADVTEYVKPQSNMFENASMQGFTLYTPTSSFPMIPEKLSSGILSLEQNKDRLTLCVKTTIDKNTGKRIGQNQIFHAVINSKQKFSYKTVEEFNKSSNGVYLTKSTKETYKDKCFVPRNALENVITSNLCSLAIWKNLQLRNQLTIAEKDELEFVMDGTKEHVLDIKKSPNYDSMKIVEALMINCNEAVAEYTRNNNLHSLYRTHEKVKEKSFINTNKILKDGNLRPFIGTENYQLQKTINYYKKTKFNKFIQKAALRMQSKAHYSTAPTIEDDFAKNANESICHSALNSKCYTHFTSGIRRFSDLIVQYAIKCHIRGIENKFDEQYAEQVSAVLSMQESNIDKAEEELNKMYSALYAKDHIGENFVGEIIEIGRNFVTVKEKSKGFCADIANTSIIDFEKSSPLALTNKFGNKIFEIGDELNFTISKVNTTNNFIYAIPNLQKENAKNAEKGNKNVYTKSLIDIEQEK